MMAVLGAGMLFLMVGSAAPAEDAFSPRLEKIMVNGQVLYQAGKQDGKTVEISGDAPARIDYTFANKGESAASEKLAVFVHFVGEDGQMAVQDDYEPNLPTTKWAKGKDVLDSHLVDLAKFKGRSLTVFIGLYAGDKRIALANEKLGDDRRLQVGILKIK